MPQPFFSIGVTTYNRLDLLRQALTSILAQSFADFEVIIGNDYVDEFLSDDLLGISDPRIQIVNHPCNLQEAGNMNALLAMASGRYFTWLADDDFYASDFLERAFRHLTESRFPQAFFSSYRVFKGTDVPQAEGVLQGRVHQFSGGEFLKSYFTGRMKIIAVYGLFDIEALRSIVGGIEALCASAVGLYVEYVFLVRCGLFDRIVYCDAPLVLTRDHVGSWGGNNTDLDRYTAAGKELIRRCGEVLRHPTLSASLTPFLLGICRLHLDTFAGKVVTVELGQNKKAIAIWIRSTINYFQETCRTGLAFVAAGGGRVTCSTRLSWISLNKYLLIMRIFAVIALKKLRNRVVEK